MFRIMLTNKIVVTVISFLLLSCANRLNNTLPRPNFSNIEWGELKVYYVVKTGKADKLDKVMISDREELLRGRVFLRRAKVTSYPYQLICLNKATTIDGIAWEFDFVFEDRIDFVLQVDRSKSYSMFSRNSDFYEWVLDKCWDNARANNPKTSKSQIKLRTGDLISVPGVREMYVP